MIFFSISSNIPCCVITQRVCNHTP